MEVLGLLRVESFLKQHADVRTSFSDWLRETRAASWLTSTDIKERYVHASFLPNNRVIFNLKGNNYRLETKVNYKNGIVTVIRLGTHAEYSRWRFE
jgi:mRNA interferase HigB